ncbi:MAG: glutamate-5-semialdehyde dehydrogenase [Spirochaetales bacterium]|nr:glutamate-5-semialdehyde dehydrogenase [Spirochaetales bacterium]
MNITELAKNAYNASLSMSELKSSRKNLALKKIVHIIKEKKDDILMANRKDLEIAENENLSKPLLKRLKFDEEKIQAVCSGIDMLIQLDDPVGKILKATELDQDLELYKISCPIGVIGIIFESRPDALVQISTLCLKSGNAVLLKGGKEALHTNKVLAGLITDAGKMAGLPDHWLTLLETREDVKDLLSLHQYVNLIIPRGSNEFVRYIMENTKIPVLGHADGICHVYIDNKTDIDIALKIVIDSKCQYVAVCNALETLLVHAEVAGELLPRLKSLLDEKGVEIRGCEKTRDIINVKPAVEADWGTEYLDTILSIKIVDSLEKAIDHINTYGSGHTDAIVTTSSRNAQKFMQRVDSADVFINCSTRFSDGYRYGLGAEVGISTNKIHARGPVGMEGLIIYKWILLGDGHIVADYAEGRKHFTHKPLDREYLSE